ncbi:MAG TPA: glycosyltransferase family 39 protein [Vicinamibacterales bacterium]
MLSDPKRIRYALAAIVVVGAALRFYPIWFGFPYPHARPDEETAVDLALAMQGGDLNPRFFHWPSFAIYLFAAVSAAAAAIRRALSLDPFTNADYVILARGLVAACGTLTIVALFRLARRTAGAATGLIAALLLAAALLHVRESHFAMTDVLMTLLLTTSLACVIQALDEGMVENTRARALQRFALAGLLGGLAASTKYSAAMIVAAMAAAQLAWLTNARKAIWSLAAWMPAVLFATSFVVGFFVGTPYALLDSGKFTADLEFDFTHLSEGHGIDLGRGWTYHLNRSLPYGVGLTTFVAAIVGLVPFARSLGRHAFVLGTFAVAFYASIGSGHTVFFRYVLPLVPIVCLLAALGVHETGRWLAARTGASRALTVGVLAAIVAVPAIVQSARLDRLLARTDTRVLAREWLAPRLKADDSLHDSGGTYARLDLQDLRFHQWAYDPASSSFGHPDGATPDWLVLHDSPLRLYASAPATLRQLAADKYELLFAVRATTGRSGSVVYDLQDAFFLPMSDLETAERPGPTIRIYRRRDAPPLTADR